MEKVKLIQGNPERAEEIRKTLEEWGGTNDSEISCENEDNYYYVDSFGYINCLYFVSGDNRIAEGRAEIYELPQPKPKCILKPFDKVLVRNDSQSEWGGDLFTHMDEDGLWHICLTGNWIYCIPYEGNEYLLGTSKKPERC